MEGDNFLKFGPSFSKNYIIFCNYVFFRSLKPAPTFLLLKMRFPLIGNPKILIRNKNERKFVMTFLGPVAQFSARAEKFTNYVFCHP